MSTLATSARVGLVVLLGIALFGGMFVFFSGNGLFDRTYRLDVLFDNADGITTGVPVELAGVQIGQVQRVELTPSHKADLVLDIKDSTSGQQVRIPTGSQFTISVPVFGSTGVIMVVPPDDAAKRPNDVITPDTKNLVGTRTGDITASLSHADALLDQLTATTRKMDALISDPRLQGHLRQTVANLDTASANGAKLTDRLNATVSTDNAQALRLLQLDNARALQLLDADNAQVQALLQQTKAGSQTALNNITDTTAQIKGTTTENRAKINQIVANMNDTSAAIAGITQQTNQLMTTGGVTQNLSATVANLKATTDKLNTIAGSLQSLTTDPTVQNNLKQTVANIKDSSEETKFLLQRLNKLAGTKRPAAVLIGPAGAVIVPPLGVGTPGTATVSHSTATVPLLLPQVDLVQNTRADHFRADVDAFVPLTTSPTAFLRAGIYGFGDTNRVNLQAGQFTSPGSLYDYRVGLYASKLSVGADAGLGQRATLSIDAYDPNTVHLNAHGIIMLAPELGLLVGGEDLTRRSGAVIGLEYRRTK
jgi:phospholipid/cholesterol/gamma-HCH transport system substrate-binding protein